MSGLLVPPWQWQGKIAECVDKERELHSRIQAAAAATVTPASPEQAQAGNYPKGKFTLHGLPISIETAHGQYRSGVSPDGKSWRNRMYGHYGYIRQFPKSEADGDHVDVFVGKHPTSELVFVINQNKPSGEFDEHKCILGCRSQAEAEELYRSNYDKSWKGLGSIVPMTLPQFKEWLESGETGKPVQPTTSKAWLQKTVDEFHSELKKRLKQGADEEAGNEHESGADARDVNSCEFGADAGVVNGRESGADSQDGSKYPFGAENTTGSKTRLGAETRSGDEKSAGASPSRVCTVCGDPKCGGPHTHPRSTGNFYTRDELLNYKKTAEHRRRPKGLLAVLHELKELKPARGSEPAKEVPALKGLHGLKLDPAAIKETYEHPVEALLGLLKRWEPKLPH